MNRIGQYLSEPLERFETGEQDEEGLWVLGELSWVLGVFLGGCLAAWTTWQMVFRGLGITRRKDER